MSCRLMITDDSRVTFAEMSKMLEGTEIEILQYCRSGEEAIEAYAQTRPDVTTMDIVMPGMDGLETARRILGKWPEARILMVSSLAYDDTIEVARTLGTKGFLFKPFTREELIQAIHMAAGQGDQPETDPRLPV